MAPGQARDSYSRSTLRLSAFAKATADWRLTNDLPYMLVFSPLTKGG